MNKRIAFLTVGLAMHVASAQAAITDEALIEGAKLCTRQMPRYEREHGIPTHLLSAIGTTESGRYHEGLKLRLPWPWTINAEGKGYYFDSKKEALAAARKLQSRGVQSMDVGCMQVNLMHHPKAFSSLEEAFEPKKNVAYAARFLRNLYDDEHSWKQAAADYHSKTPGQGKQYVGQVYNSWYQIIDKLRLAKQQLPAGTQMAMNDLSPSAGSVTLSQIKPVAMKRPEVKSANIKTVEIKTVERPQPVAKKLVEKKSIEPLTVKVATYKPAHMNTIEMSKKNGMRENGVFVVRPEIKVVNAPVAVTTSSAQMKPITVAHAKPDIYATAKVVQVGALTSRRSGPTFIFSD